MLALDRNTSPERQDINICTADRLLLKKKETMLRGGSKTEGKRLPKVESATCFSSALDDFHHYRNQMLI